MTQIAIVIPAAGASRRMRGTDKLLEPVGGLPLLRRVAKRALAVSDTVLVTLPDLTSARADALKGLDVRMIHVTDASLGMSHSLKDAAHALPASALGLMVVPADMPDLTVDDMGAMIRHFGDTDPPSILQATSAEGRPGHPVIFPRDLLAGFDALSGDTGARALLAQNRHRVRHIALPENHALTDLDTPEAWAAWRASNSTL